jgi:phosphatidylglycerol lysyltransferase
MFHRYNNKFDQPGAMIDRLSRMLGKRSILSPVLALLICGLLLAQIVSKRLFEALRFFIR